MTTITEERRRVCAAVLRELEQRSMTKRALALRCKSSDPQIQRAITLLRDHGAPIEYDRGWERWRLVQSGWTLPIELKTREGLIAMIEELRS